MMTRNNLCRQDGGPQPLETKGQTISWASVYDWLVKLASLGKETSFRKKTVALAHLKLVIDIESSADGSLFQKLSDFIIQLHGGHTAMQNNVKKLILLLKAAGFTGVKTDRGNRQFSAVRGRKAPAS